MVKRIEIVHAPKLPTYHDIIGGLDEAGLRQTIAREQATGDVQNWWESFIKDKGHPVRGTNKDLTMLTASSDNLKLAKNQNLGNPDTVRRTQELGLSIPEHTTSGLFDACAGCSTEECRITCNGKSGHYSQWPAERAKQTRGAAIVNNPQFAMAKVILEAKRAVNSNAYAGMHTALRMNMWNDYNYTKNKGLAPVLIGDFEEPPRNWQGDSSGALEPAIKHTNYTKETMNRVLLPGETGIDKHGYDKNYHVAYSTHNRTPARRVEQGLDLGQSLATPVWGKVRSGTNFFAFQDKENNRVIGKSFSGDEYDDRSSDSIVQPAMQSGEGAFSLLSNKSVPNMKQMEGRSTEASFIRPQDPDAPVGSKLGIPSKYASEETKQRLGEVTKTGKTISPRTIPWNRRNINSDQFGA